MSDFFTSPLTKGYDPKAIEEPWYSFWEKNGIFEASHDPKETRPSYVIPMPPPNVTGSLHMGHALFCTLQDILVRYHRMDGYNTLWQPGIDHAGIATQTVVERQLAREGKNRFDLGRLEFEQRVWQWKEESGGRIQEQLRLIGASSDWKRSKFTMDPDMSEAVREAFVQLHEAGLMYRATRLINWCPECRTALSDLEVNNEGETEGELFFFAYPLEEGQGELVVSTTRPETMLADTAVAVHPQDPRYLSLHGKYVIHPFVDRKIPIITDPILVDPMFGTGAVKVTPAHDFNDFEAGKRNQLEELNLFHLDGTLNEQGGPFQGFDRFKARKKVKQALIERGFARGARPHRMTLPRCQRSGGVIEPMLSTQWFLRMKQMAEQAIEAIHSGQTIILPTEWTKTYLHFLENIQDWCVSRQLWWGHQIPAWYGLQGEIRVARSRPAECGEGWVQDGDVLDTWFSAALWPFSTLGWPKRTAALQTFYPASDLETGYDILFFWVARMMMFGIHFMGAPPFKRVLLHGLIVDETGCKMSKVKGNVIDPLDLIQGASFDEILQKTSPCASKAEALQQFKAAYPSTATMGIGFPAFGADALRFTLATFSPNQPRISLAPKKIEGYRYFANKIWNAMRYALDHIQGTEVNSGIHSPHSTQSPDWFYNRWILCQLEKTIRAVRNGLDQFRIDDAAHAFYQFFWNDVCDWYLELTKMVFTHSESPYRSHHAETKKTLAAVMEASLRLLHPFMPFLTEELWQRLPKSKPHPISIAIAPFPHAASLEGDEKSSHMFHTMEILQTIISAARTLRSQYEVPPSSVIPIDIRVEESLIPLLTEHTYVIEKLTKATPLHFHTERTTSRPAGTSFTVIPTLKETIEVIVHLKGFVSAEKEKARIDRALRKLEKDLAAINRKLNNPDFFDRAPQNVVNEAEAQRKSLLEAKEYLEQAFQLAQELENTEKS
ncbi:valine--tRNA ligase [Pajaroellobacter abortibovis]|uniref:Valine--tRNA ligase n=1 Tax=Pajaroellobacter abortibovis TaxID=1882918 RepID=A0A1L6MWT2_9BACT|nr:valine--tRNA ligase [Pajaroellobacter abortibovis]APR99895.1 valine--tRNA ligase [Pajaroellobacter abortibovis]